MKFEAPTHWTLDFLAHGIFTDLNRLFSLNQFNDWPAIDWLNQQAEGILNSNKQQIKFIANDDIDWQHGYYEEIIFDKGVIPTRLKNWHDLFGAFIWLLFPKTKALLNKMHIEQIKLNGITERCKKRNAITLLDECGVIVIGDEQLFSDLKGHLWQKSFVENRNCWHHSIIPFMFGHANYEMATRPYIGLTGKALYIAAHQSEIPQPLNKRYAWLDEKLSTLIIDESLLNNNNQLFPLPFLGVPGWYDKNKDNTFYENTDYFRPKRRKIK